MSLTQLLEAVELLTDQVGTKITLIADQQLIVENLEEKVDDQTAEMQKIKEKQEQQEQVSVELLKTLKEENRTILETLAAIQKMQKEIRDEQKLAMEKIENLEKGQEIQKKVEKMCKDVDDLYQRVGDMDESDFDASTIVEDIIGLWKHHEPYSTGDRFCHFERRGDQIIERYSDSKATAQGRPGGNYQQYPVYVDYIDIDSSLVGDRLETFGVGREMEGHDVLFVDYGGEEYTIYYRVH